MKISIQYSVFSVPNPLNGIKESGHAATVFIFLIVN
jgi:hypothetical protein